MRPFAPCLPLRPPPFSSLSDDVAAEMPDLEPHLAEGRALPDEVDSHPLMVSLSAIDVPADDDLDDDDDSSDLELAIDMDSTSEEDFLSDDETPTLTAHV
eukprot:2328438-Pleurochrysis_carterae.AAC.2